MNVTVTRQYRVKEGSTTSNVYSFSVGTSGGGGANIIPVTSISPAVLAFANTQTPSILDYQTDYAALYGPWPRVILITFDENDNMDERVEKPKRNIVDDKLDSIVWDLGIVIDSGLIIIYPTT